MKPKTMFNQWILTKIISYLSTKEGCFVQKSGFTKAGAKTILHDSFGFVYEVSIKTIGRVQTDSTEMVKYKGA